MALRGLERAMARAQGRGNAAAAAAIGRGEVHVLRERYARVDRLYLRWASKSTS